MTRGQALTHLIRVRDMKVKRLENWRGTDRSADYLRADIGALNYAIALIEIVQDDLVNAARRAAV